MEIVDLGEWLNDTEKCISQAIARCSPRNWDEDHISRSWLQALVNGPRATAIRAAQRSPFSVAWDAYKADGPLEEGHGDIAFLVRCKFRSGDPIEGVGFLEAKRVYRNGSYTALDREQLIYQSSRVENHRLLLYDHVPIHEAAANLVSQGFCQVCTQQPYGAVHAAVIPTQHAVASGEHGRSLHSLSTPLSHQICFRYLRGLDLDWSPNLVRAVRAGVIDQIRFLFVAHAFVGVEGNPDIATLEIDQEIFQRLPPGDDFVYES